MSHLRLVTWNILHGGGPRRVPLIALALVELKPDVVVLTEFRRARGSGIRAVLADAGLEHQHAAEGEGNGVLIASRHAISQVKETPAVLSPRWAMVHTAGLEVCGVHMPDDSDNGRKAAFWQAVIHIARSGRGRPLVFLGDFNTGRRGQDGRFFACESMLGTLLSLGYVDAWRHMHPDAREASWEGGRGSARVDAAYLSPALGDALVECRMDHTLRTRGLSDHSAVIVVLKGTGLEASGRAPRLFEDGAGW